LKKIFSFKKFLAFEEIPSEHIIILFLQKEEICTEEYLSKYLCLQKFLQKQEISSKGRLCKFYVTSRYFGVLFFPYEEDLSLQEISLKGRNYFKKDSCILSRKKHTYLWITNTEL